MQNPGSDILIQTLLSKNSSRIILVWYSGDFRTPGGGVCFSPLHNLNIHWNVQDSGYGGTEKRSEKNARKTGVKENSSPNNRVGSYTFESILFSGPGRGSIFLF